MRIGIAGRHGRMGQAVAEAVARTPGLVLAGGIDQQAGAADGVLADIAALAAVSDVVIDFTHASAIVTHARALAAARVPWVLGTTGADAAGNAAIAAAAGQTAIFEAANFSVGVNLLLGLAETLGRVLPADAYDAEILEMHHAGKRDAPSGTALALGHAVARGRGVPLTDVARTARVGQVGPRPAGEIGFACLRGGAVVGEHSVIFTAGTEQIILSHRAMDRSVFAEGALRAAQWLPGKPPGRYTMRDLLAV